MRTTRTQNFYAITVTSLMLLVGGMTPALGQAQSAGSAVGSR